MDLYINEYGSRINLNNGVITISKEGKILKEIPLKKIGSLVIHSSVQITSQAIAALSENGCSISWVNGVDKLICSTDCDNIGHVQRRKHQYRLTDNMRFRLSISKSIIISKLLSHCEVLRSCGASFHDIEEFEKFITASCKKCKKQNNYSSLRGIEGNCANIYFRMIQKLLPEGFDFESRTRQPPQDEFNALLSFLYSLLYNETSKLIRIKGLDPYAGFMHEIKNGHYALASDIMEEFRYICDITALTIASSFNKDTDFSKDGVGVYLSASGRAKSISAFKNFMNKECYYIDQIGYGNTVQECLKWQIDKIADAVDSEHAKCFEPYISEKSYALRYSV